MQSTAETVAEYLAGLPQDRRQAIELVRRTILEHLPEGYEEAMNWGMITYQIPLDRYPDTYNGQPLIRRPGHAGPGRAFRSAGTHRSCRWAAGQRP